MRGTASDQPSLDSVSANRIVRAIRTTQASTALFARVELEMLADETGLPVGIKSAIGELHFFDDLARLMAEGVGSRLWPQPIPSRLV